MGYYTSKYDKDQDKAANDFIRSANNKLVREASKLEEDAASHLAQDVFQHGADWVSQWSGSVPWNPNAMADFSAGRNALVLKDKVQQDELQSDSFISKGMVRSSRGTLRVEDGAQPISLKNYYESGRHLKQRGYEVYRAKDVSGSEALASSPVKDVFTGNIDSATDFLEQINETLLILYQYSPDDCAINVQKDGDSNPGKFEAWTPETGSATIPSRGSFENVNEFLYVIIHEQCRAAVYQEQQKPMFADDLSGRKELRNFGVGGNELLIDMAALLTCDQLGISLEALGKGRVSEEYQESKEQRSALLADYLCTHQDGGKNEFLLHIATEGRRLSNGMENLYAGETKPDRLDLDYHDYALVQMQERINQFNKDNQDR